MELRHYSRPLFRRGWLPVLGALVAMGVSYSAIRYQSSRPLYQATATVLIGGDILTRDSDWTSFQMSKNLLPTYAELAKRPPVTQAVVDALGLSVSADELRKSISASVVGETQLIEISVTDDDPQRAADIANEVAQQLAEQAPIAAPPGFVRTTERAHLPRPSVTSHIGVVVAGMTGLVLGIGTAFLIEHFDDTIRAPEDVAQGLGLPPLGAVKYFNSVRRGRLFSLLQRNPEKEREVPVEGHFSGILGQLRDVCFCLIGHLAKLLPWSPEEKEREISGSSLSSLAEACRILSVNISHLGAGSLGKLLITSPGSSEGKSTVAVGLATAWAETGQKIALVDAHLRRPKLHERFGLSNDVSLSALLEQKSGEYRGKARSETMASTERANLAAFLSGSSHSQRSSCLSSPQLQDVLDDLAKQADVVIVDGPPVLSSPDAAILASKVHGILLVLTTGKTRLKAAVEAAEILTRAGGTILGAALFSSE